VNKGFLSNKNICNTEDFGLIEVGWLNVLLLKFREKNFFKSGINYMRVGDNYKGIQLQIIYMQIW
jgi:hypothetical protein